LAARKASVKPARVVRRATGNLLGLVQIAHDDCRHRATSFAHGALDTLVLAGIAGRMRGVDLQAAAGCLDLDSEQNARIEEALAAARQVYDLPRNDRPPAEHRGAFVEVDEHHSQSAEEGPGEQAFAGGGVGHVVAELAAETLGHVAAS